MPQQVTYSSSTKLHKALGVFSIVTVAVLTLIFSHESFAFEPQKVTVNTINSQAMVLLSPQFGIEVPKAIGGPDAPYIEGGALHPHVGISSTISSQVEQDKDGISYYIVQQGDTVSEIAELFNVSTNTISWENKLGKSIKAGQELRILPVTGIRHKVSKGDTISKIAQSYEVEQEDITIYNSIDESKLVVGEMLIIPNGVKQKAVVPSRSRTTSYSGVSSSVSSGYYIRPTGGSTTSRFGPRSRGYHYGIDYGAPTGTPIVAAASGTVTKTSCGSGYGKCLVIQHNNGTQTLYAHASVLYVSAGTSVKQGQKIAAVGSTGRSTGPHLHFEIVKANGQKLNPDKYIR